MAQPYTKNGRWYVRYKDAKSAWRDKATTARTKTEARRLQLELERKTERERLGLEPLPSGTPEMTFGAGMDLWWSEHGRRLRSNTIRRFMEKHLDSRRHSFKRKRDHLRHGATTRQPRGSRSGHPDRYEIRSTLRAPCPIGSTHSRLDARPHSREAPRHLT